VEDGAGVVLRRFFELCARRGRKGCRCLRRACVTPAWESTAKNGSDCQTTGSDLRSSRSRLDRRRIELDVRRSTLVPTQPRGASTSRPANSSSGLASICRSRFHFAVRSTACRANLSCRTPADREVESQASSVSPNGRRARCVAGGSCRFDDAHGAEKRADLVRLDETAFAMPAAVAVREPRGRGDEEIVASSWQSPSSRLARSSRRSRPRRADPSIDTIGSRAPLSSSATSSGRLLLRGRAGHLAVEHMS